MLKNFTLGQYISGNSFLHRVNPKVKLVFSFIYVFLLFFVNSFFSLGFCLIGIVSIYFFCKFSFRLICSNLKLILVFLAIAAVFNMFFINSGDVIFKFFLFKITTNAVCLTIKLVLRIFLLIAGSSLLTYTTLPLDLTLAIEELLKPLAKFRLPVSEIAIMMSIALRFVPLLISEAETIIVAQRSRGMNLFNQRGLIKKVKSFSVFIVPLLVLAFKSANELAVSMEARCFKVGQKRTRYKSLKFQTFDLIFSIGCAFFLFLVGSLNICFKA